MGDNKKKHPSLVGQVFGKLTVVERNGSSKNKQRLWSCKCQCGGSTTLSTTKLLHRKQKGCGLCYRNIFRRKELSWIALNSFGAMYHTYQASAAKKNRDFNLSINDFEILAQGNCNYCGVEPIKEYKVCYSKTGETYKCNGIDRVDSSKGYTLENCVSCCTKCNIAKNKWTVTDFQAWLLRASIYQLNKFENEKNK